MVEAWCFDGLFWALKILHFFEIYFLPLGGLGFAALVCGGEFAEAGDGGGDDFEGFVDLFGGGETGEGEADAGASACGCEAHGGEDVGGFGCAGLAG
jgi:hypothetical protein